MATVLEHKSTDKNSNSRASSKINFKNQKNQNEFEKIFVNFVPSLCA
jgi:hypothetical protein